MSLKTFVKVGNITNLTDARYCAGMGVNQLGFNVEDPNFTVEKFKEITGWLEGIEYVAEFDKLAADKVITAVEQLGVAGRLEAVEPAGQVLPQLAAAVVAEE